MKKPLMKVLHLKRIERLVKHLLTLPREEFDLAHWFCGTTACAMGHACGIPAFQKLGLQRKHDLPAFGGYFGCRAAGELFGISHKQSRQFFLACFYQEKDWNNPKAVARRLKAFVKRQYARRERAKLAEVAA